MPTLGISSRRVKNVVFAISTLAKTKQSGTALATSVRRPFSSPERPERAADEGAQNGFGRALAVALIHVCLQQNCTHAP